MKKTKYYLILITFLCILAYIHFPSLRIKYYLHQINANRKGQLGEEICQNYAKKLIDCGTNAIPFIIDSYLENYNSRGIGAYTPFILKNIVGSREYINQRVKNEKYALNKHILINLAVKLGELNKINLLFELFCDSNKGKYLYSYSKMCSNLMLIWKLNNKQPPNFLLKAKEANLNTACWNEWWKSVQPLFLQMNSEEKRLLIEYWR